MNIETLIADQKRIYIWGILSKRIRFALWPWEPGRITMWNDDTYRLSHDVVEVRIEVELLPDLPFIGYPQLWMTQDEMFWDLADRAFTFFRYRPALPVEDHIILGEN